LHNCAYLQLDATLRAVQLSVLCAPLAIVVNGLLPIGFVMSPRKSSDLSTTFARFILFKEMAGNANGCDFDAATWRGINAGGSGGASVGEPIREGVLVGFL
jgi:hypothetical protein